jgi:hypothetical protein
MKTFVIIPRLLALAVLFTSLGFTSCNKDKEDEPQPQVFDDVRDYAVGEYAYTMIWQDVSSGVPVDIEDMAPITGTVEVKKSPTNRSAIDLYEDGELFLTFDDVRETREGFSFNHSWMMLPYDGETYSFFGYDSFPMDGDEEAGVYYRNSQELNFAWFVEIGNSDLTLTFRSERVK